MDSSFIYIRNPPGFYEKCNKQQKNIYIYETVVV